MNIDLATKSIEQLKKECESKIRELIEKQFPEILEERPNSEGAIYWNINRKDA